VTDDEGDDSNIDAPSLTVAVDLTAAQNAERTSVTDLSSVRAQAADGALSLDAVQQATEARQDLVVDITAEVRVGSMTAAEVQAEDAPTAPAGDDESDAAAVQSSGIIEIDCQVPENFDLQECRINLGSQE